MEFQNTRILTGLNRASERASYLDGHIDKMTYKWLNSGQNSPRIPEFYTLTKINKSTPVGRPIVSGSGGPTERISSFVDKQESYIKDTTHFINFIENTPLPDNAVLVTLDVCSLDTNIPQEEEINVVCQYYGEHYQSKPSIPTSFLGDLIRLILKKNSFKFNDKLYLQTHGIAMGTKMAVAVIFMAHIDKQLLLASPHKPILCKRFLLTTPFQCGLYPSEKSTTLSISLIYSTPLSNSRMKCHLRQLFSTSSIWSNFRSILLHSLISG